MARNHVLLKRALYFYDNYEAEHDRPPSNIEIAAHCGVGRRTVSNWKAVFRLSGIAEITRDVVSLGRSKIETASRMVIDWKKANAVLTTSGERLRAQRNKARGWLNSAALLRCAIFSDQPELYIKTLPSLPVPVVKTSRHQPRRAGSIWDQTNFRFDAPQDG